VFKRAAPIEHRTVRPRTVIAGYPADPRVEARLVQRAARKIRDQPNLLSIPAEGERVGVSSVRVKAPSVDPKVGTASRV
jgi:hypothetical protein